MHYVTSLLLKSENNAFLVSVGDGLESTESQ